MYKLAELTIWRCRVELVSGVGHGLSQKFQVVHANFFAQLQLFVKEILNTSS